MFIGRAMLSLVVTGNQCSVILVSSVNIVKCVHECAVSILAVDT